MNIVFASDNNYVNYLSICLCSILENNKHHAINFYILSQGISEDGQRQLMRVVNAYPDKTITFIPIPMEKFVDFPITIDYISLVTYARLALVDIFDWGDVNKLIYLDIDILVNGDLGPLWNIDLGDHAIGACLDSFVEFEIQQDQHKEKLGLRSDHIYFNAGV
ncbi:glycosyltransferase family 8 protein, partial [Basilea psittacipulmonis]